MDVRVDMVFHVACLLKAFAADIAFKHLVPSLSLCVPGVEYRIVSFV